MKRFNFLFAIFIATVAIGMMSSGVQAQVGGGLGGGDSGSSHQYPDLYDGDSYILGNPNAAGVAFIDRETLDDYPNIVFSNWDDFVEAIEFEEDTLRDFFPLGANLTFWETEEDNWGLQREHKYVFEPESDQFLFENAETADFFRLLNPSSFASFVLFADGDKPVRPVIGWVYVVVVTNDDDSTTTYVGSTGVGPHKTRWKNHDHIDLFSDPTAVITVQPVRGTDIPGTHSDGTSTTLEDEIGHILAMEETKKIWQLFEDAVWDQGLGGQNIDGLDNKQWPLSEPKDTLYNPNQFDPHRYRNYEMEFVPNGNGNGGGTLEPKDPSKVPTGWEFNSFDDPANTNN